nr:angiotensin-converting enzyme-like isoform X1 [Onthophagus taurus]
MRIPLFILVVTLITINVKSSDVHSKNATKKFKKPLTERELSQFLSNEFEKKESESCFKQASAEWDHLTDIDHIQKEQIAVDATIEGAKLDKKYWSRYFHRADPAKCKDCSLARQVTKLAVLGNSALNENDLRTLTGIISNMTKIYSTAKVKSYEKWNFNGGKRIPIPLEPDLINIMAKTRDYKVLKYYWVAWRNATGSKLKSMFYDYVQLSNKAAKNNDFQDKGAMWRSDFEDENFVETMESLWKEVRPLYNELQEYVLNEFKTKYAEFMDESDTLIPAHLLGNMWAQDWVNIAPYVIPYPKEEKLNVTKLLLEKHYTVIKMFQTADNFYKSLGLESNSMSFNKSEGAMIEKPRDGRNVLCHASAWDFCNGKDFRIKMCAEVNFENFMTIHHEMGHIEYYQLYKHQPYAFRSGANPGFHEAIGDTIALSVTTSKHLHRIGLLDKLHNDTKTELNDLMYLALERVAFLPYGYLLDKWRWDVFEGTVDPEYWNSHYWKYRETIQKVSPPVDRKIETDFDPAAKYHIVADSQYISYFFARILEFQLHKALCVAAGEYVPGNVLKPLHKCDIYQSKKAGELLRRGLSLGASVHWTEVLEKITGTKKLSGAAILEYFDPLYEFLVEKNTEYANSQRKKRSCF